MSAPHHPTDAIGRGLGRLCGLSAAVGGVILVAMASTTVVSVVGRAFFSHPILGDVELVQLGCAVVVAAFLPYAQFRRANTLADFKGLKLRSPTRRTHSCIALRGATPVSMAAPRVGHALSKGVIDGAVVLYEVVPALKIHERVKHHCETDPAEAAFHTSVFIVATHEAKGDPLPAELKKVIGTHSGQTLSGMAGKAFCEADAEGKKPVMANTINLIPKSELENWKPLGHKLAGAWVSGMNRKGQNGKQMLDGAKALIAKHTVAKRGIQASGEGAT